MEFSTFSNFPRRQNVHVNFSLGSTRFFKVARARSREGLCVVKVFVIHDPSLPLKNYKEQIEGQSVAHLLIFFWNKMESLRSFLPLISQKWEWSCLVLRTVNHFKKPRWVLLNDGIGGIICGRSWWWRTCSCVFSYLCEKGMFLLHQLSDKAALLYRQYVKDSLYDRISTRPFLNTIEKKWLAFQLLCALNQCHKLNVSEL